MATCSSTALRFYHHFGFEDVGPELIPSGFAPFIPDPDFILAFGRTSNLFIDGRAQLQPMLDVDIADMNFPEAPIDAIRHRFDCGIAAEVGVHGREVELTQTFAA
jgi:hypothetical protein